MYPCYFNDVFAPIMIGPSSSACAGPTNIGLLARNVAGGTPKHLTIQYVPNSSRAAMQTGMATTIGFIVGVLGYNAQDKRLYNAYNEAKMAGMEVEVLEAPIPGNDNPNYMLLTLRMENGTTHTILSDSIGGGIIELLNVDGFPVERIRGEEWVLMVKHDRQHHFEEELEKYLQTHGVAEHVLRRYESLNEMDSAQQMSLVYLEKPVNEENLHEMEHLPGAFYSCQLNPVLPVPTRLAAKPQLFSSVAELIALAKAEGVDCAEIAIRYEMDRSALPREEVIALMDNIWSVLLGTVEQGKTGKIDHLRGPQHPPYCNQFLERMEKRDYIMDDFSFEMLATAAWAYDGRNDIHTLSVAGPAAGCPPILMGALLPFAKKYGYTREEMVRAMFVAAAIGAVAYTKSIPTGEVLGCGGEVGISAAMAAGVMVTLQGAPPEMVDTAASIALMNMFGVPCDPIGGGACSMPCRARTHMAPFNALMAAELAMTGFRSVVPFDQAYEALDRVYGKMPGFMKGDNTDGISTTPAALAATADFQQWAKKNFK